MKWPLVTRRWAQKELAKMAEHLCDHRWEITGATFTAPTHRRFEAWGYDDVFVRQMIRGFTKVTRRCSRCGDVKVTTHTGRVQVPGCAWKDVA